jgi:hypothetical protein
MSPELNVYRRFHLPARKHLLTPEIEKIISQWERLDPVENIIIDEKLQNDK